MKNKPSQYALIFLLVCSLSACQQTPNTSVAANQSEETESTEDNSVSSAILKETEDRGEAYLDGFIFLGESTTYHLKSRGVLKEGTATKQVWGPDSGTINLDASILSLRIHYPDTDEYLTISQALTKKQPAYLVLTFGLNGAPRNIRLGKQYYQSCYRLLLDAIADAAPHTKVILQSCFPIADNMDMSRYTCTLEELNGYIDIINDWVLELAEEYRLKYLNTTEILKDENGYLKSSYQNGDGHHLTKEAYQDILLYLRTHGYP